MKRLQDKIKSLPTNRQKKIQARVEEQLVELRLADLREKRQIAQKDLAATLGLTKSAISQLEKRQQIGLETLLKYVIATGGRLEVRAVYPDETEVLL